MISNSAYRRERFGFRDVAGPALWEKREKHWFGVNALLILARQSIG